VHFIGTKTSEVADWIAAINAVANGEEPPGPAVSPRPTTSASSRDVASIPAGLRRSSGTGGSGSDSLVPQLQRGKANTNEKLLMKTTAKVVAKVPVRASPTTPPAAEDKPAAKGVAGGQVPGSLREGVLVLFFCKIAFAQL
jgi:hypothetical protein